MADHPSHLPSGSKASSGSETGHWVRDHLHHKLSSLVQDLLDHEIDLNFAKKELETAYITEILQRNNSNIGQSAKILGMHRNTLSKRIKELKISTDKSP